MKRKIYATIALSCAILLVGTVGALEANTISCSSAIHRTIIATPIFMISLFKGGFVK